MLEIEAFKKKFQFEGDIAEYKEVKLENGLTGEVYIMDSYFKNRSKEEIEEIIKNYSLEAQKAYGLMSNANV